MIIEDMADEDFLMRAQESFAQMDRAIDEICRVLFPLDPCKPLGKLGQSFKQEAMHPMKKMNV